MRCRVFAAAGMAFSLSALAVNLSSKVESNLFSNSVETALMALQSPPRFFLSDLDQSKIILDLGTTQSSMGTFTVFLPTDEAINRFGCMGLIRPPSFGGSGSQEMYLKFMRYHIAKGAHSAREILSRGFLTTLAGQDIATKALPPILYSVETKNGIIHVIDSVLIHPDLKRLVGSYATKKRP